MDWPRTPVERIPAKRFKPPFCPKRHCRSHRDHDFRWVRDGYYRRKCDRRTIPRFRCRICNGRFSLQTFSTTYYLKRPDLLSKVAACLVACGAARQVARTLGCSHTTVVHQANRIGRHALLLHADSLETMKAIEEPLVLDHMETFEYCQEMQLGVATVVGSRTGLVLALDPVPHRSGGEMTPGRAKRLHALVERHGPLPAGSYRRSTERVLARLLPKAESGSRLHLIADGKPSYRKAAQPHIDSGRLRLDTYLNPPRRRKHEPNSRSAVARDRAMFPVDVLHKLIRHSNANHKRETIAHGRRANAVMLRLYVLAAWVNYIKDQSVRTPRDRTPGMAAGLIDRFLDWKQLLGRRLFPWRRKLSGMDRKLYSMAMITPAVGNNRRHDLINAF